MFRSDQREIGERLKDDIVKFGIVSRQGPCVQFFRAAQSLVILLLCVQQLFRGSVSPVRICNTIKTNIRRSVYEYVSFFFLFFFKSDRTSRDSPPIGSYCLAESSINKTSPCNNPTSAAGSTSAREPASNNLGLQTRYFNNTGATTDEIAPGDTPGSCNQTREIPDKYAAMISQSQGESSFVVENVKGDGFRNSKVKKVVSLIFLNINLYTANKD